MKAYVYPNIERERLGSKNPYISNLKESLAGNGFIVGQNYAKSAFLDLLKKGYSSDCIVLNWIEDIPSKRFGFGQMVIFYFFVLIYKLNCKKIIWIKHNKISHSKSNWKLKKAMQSFLTSKADLILTHAKETGLNKLDKLFFIHHPNTIDINKVLRPCYNNNTTIDFLIWGSIIPYKGILEFLQFAHGNDSLKGIKIHVVGKCDDLNYLNELNKYKSENVQIENKFVSDGDLKDLFSKSRFILFTYKSASVMSSGTLIESLSAGKRIIGPKCGAFNDLEEEGFVTTYTSFESIISVYHLHRNDYILKHENLLDFIKGTNWLNFGLYLKTIINNTARIRLLIS